MEQSSPNKEVFNSGVKLIRPGCDYTSSLIELISIRIKPQSTTVMPLRFNASHKHTQGSDTQNYLHINQSFVISIKFTLLMSQNVDCRGANEKWRVNSPIHPWHEACHIDSEKQFIFSNCLHLHINYLFVLISRHLTKLMCSTARFFCEFKQGEFQSLSRLVLMWLLLDNHNITQ